MDFSLGAHAFRFSGIDPETEFLILKRFLPIVGDLVPWIMRSLTLIGEVTPENKADKVQEAADMFADFSKAGGEDMIAQALKAIGNMEDREALFVMRTVLRYVAFDSGAHSQTGETQWRRITQENGTTFQFEQFSPLPFRLAIVSTVVGGMVRGFFVRRRPDLRDLNAFGIERPREEPDWTPVAFPDDLDGLYAACDHDSNLCTGRDIRTFTGFTLMDILFFRDLVEAKRENARRYDAAMTAFQQNRQSD